MAVKALAQPFPSFRENAGKASFFFFVGAFFSVGSGVGLRFVMFFAVFVAGIRFAALFSLAFPPDFWGTRLSSTKVKTKN